MPEESCEFPKINATTDEIRQIFQKSKSIAIVGLSDKADRPSHGVAAYLMENGYRIIPVNPVIQEVLGQKSYPNLKSIPEKIDVVDIFRKPSEVPSIVEEAIAIGAKTIWMQEGIVHNQSAEKAKKAGLQVVMNKCMLKEHRKMNTAR